MKKATESEPAPLPPGVLGFPPDIALPQRVWHLLLPIQNAIDRWLSIFNLGHLFDCSHSSCGSVFATIFKSAMSDMRAGNGGGYERLRAAIDTCRCAIEMGEPLREQLLNFEKTKQWTYLRLGFDNVNRTLAMLNCLMRVWRTNNGTP